MKKLFLLMLSLAALTFNACNKDDNGDGNETYTGKLIKTIDLNEEGVYTFTYDNQQRLTKVVSEWDGERSEIYYTYSSNRIVAAWDDCDYIYHLDADGYLIEQEWEESGSDPELGFKYQYTDGFLSRIVNLTNTDTAYTYSWANGNLSKAGDETYTYTDKENKLNLNAFQVLGMNPFRLDEEYLDFKGTSPKNLPASIPNSIDHGSSVSFTYTFDSDGYPTEIVISDSEGNELIEITYY